MKRGDRVSCRVLPGDTWAERIFWQEYSTYIQVVRLEVYKQADKRQDEMPAAFSMGFPKEDVKPSSHL